MAHTKEEIAQAFAEYDAAANKIKTILVDGIQALTEGVRHVAHGISAANMIRQEQPLELVERVKMPSIKELAGRLTGNGQ